MLKLVVLIKNLIYWLEGKFKKIWPIPTIGINAAHFRRVGWRAKNEQVIKQSYWYFGSPNDMFGKCMSILNTLIVRYFTLLLDATERDINDIQARLDGGENPRNLKLELASAIVERFHSATDAEAAKIIY